MNPTSSYLVIGHVTRDILPDRTAIGGTASFAAAVALSLGHRARVLTSADSACEFPSGANPEHVSVDGPPPEPESQASIDCVPARETTTFEYEWVEGRRIQRLTRIAGNLGPSNVPTSWLPSDIWHLGPVAGEIDIDIVDVIPAGAFLGITPQGWMRRVDAESVVHPKAWNAPAKLLNRAHAVVLSRDDIPDAYEWGAGWARAGAIVAVTEAADGATIFAGDRRLHIPALPAEPMSELGSGDLFAAFFFDCLARGVPPEQAGRFAAAATSLWISRRTAAARPTRQEIIHATKSLVT